jgi:hypothetical protein
MMVPRDVQYRITVAMDRGEGSPSHTLVPFTCWANNLAEALARASDRRFMEWFPAEFPAEDEAADVPDDPR